MKHKVTIVRELEALVKMKLLSEKNSLVRRLLPLCFVALMPLSASAQEDELLVRRGGCMPELTDGVVTGRAAVQRLLRGINTNWDPNRTYRQLVILLTFSDTEFSMDDPLGTYSRIFNEPGYNQRQGAGCVADYFRSQSHGMFNLQFDVFGPYQVSSKAQPYDNPNENTKNYAANSLREATVKFIDENPNIDYTVYDWDGNGQIEQVIFVCAGYTGNQKSTKSFGHIWPNTGLFNVVTAPDNTEISYYSTSAELWVNEESCGIGTICHEFSHALGLPDIYPTGKSSWTYSVVDEWDLMDGGNFTNYGWCPPNYTALERYLLGWETYEELTEPTTVTDMKPLSEGGKAYVIKHTDNEYLLLENRQWRGWDAGLPGKGLIVYHVNYVANAWYGNTPNNTSNHPNFYLMDNDEFSYEDWTAYLKDHGVTTQSGVYQNPTDRMNSQYFMNAYFPYGEGDVKIDSLTDNSVPFTLMYNTNAQNSNYLSKPITNIKMSEDGLVSFDFMGGSTATAIHDIAVQGKGGAVVTYDLNGRQVSSVTRRGLYLIRKPNGTIKKFIR